MITKEQALEKIGMFYKNRNFIHTSLKNKDQTPLRSRRNGETKTWKKNPERFRIPIKIGLNGYSEITNENAQEWDIT